MLQHSRVKACRPPLRGTACLLKDKGPRGETEDVQLSEASSAQVIVFCPGFDIRFRALLPKMASGLASLVGGYGSGSDSGDASEAEKGAVPEKGEKDEQRVEKEKTVGRRKDDLDNEEESSSDESDEDSSDDDGTNQRYRKKSDKNPPPPNASSLPLPSVDDLFSSTAGPNFLAAPSAGQDFVVEAMKKNSASKLSSASGASSASNDGLGQNKRGREGVGGVAGSGTRGGVPPGVVKRPKGGAVGPTGPPAEKGKKKGGVGEKISAKDKVKGQRLKGQSGIGSDFRVWKSDLEMTMRQQYD